MPIRNQFVGATPGMMAGLPISMVAMRAAGPLIACEIQPPQRLIMLPGTPVVPTPAVGLALIDTGASATCVDENALKALGTQPVGITQVQTPSGAADQLIYPAEITFPGSTLPRKTFAAVIGSPHLAAQGIVALIGRDVLAEAVLIYNGPLGVFTLAF